MMAVFFFIVHKEVFKFHAQPQTGGYSCSIVYIIYKDWVCYHQELWCLKYFPASPPVSCNAFDVDYQFKDFVITDV